MFVNFLIILIGVVAFLNAIWVLILTGSWVGTFVPLFISFLMIALYSVRKKTKKNCCNCNCGCHEEK